MNRKECNKYH